MSGDEQDTLDRRGWEIAANARRYRLLSRRPEFLSHDRAVRADHALSDQSLPTLDLFDAVMVVGASELDRFCGFAVALIDNQKQRSHASLLDAIGILDPGRVAAIYFALKPERRKVMRTDPACAYHVQQVEQDYAESEKALEEMIAETGGTTVGYDLARVAFGFEKDGSAGDDRQRHEGGGGSRGRHITTASWEGVYGTRRPQTDRLAESCRHLTV